MFRALLLMAMTVAAATHGQDAPAASGPDTASAVGPDDTITIVALNCEEISKAWRVGASGEINLPMVGRVRAAGKTVEQLEQELAIRLRPYVLEPEVTVYISESRSRPVTVTGAVQNPGIVQLRGPSTLFAVLMMAGGPKDVAVSVTLTRGIDHGRIPYPGAADDPDEKFSILELPIKDLSDGHSAASNIVVQPQDVISVAQDQQQRLVHIVGDVVKPGAVELINQPSVSLMKVLAVAGGLTRTSSPQHTIIRHIGSEGVQTETAVVDLKMIIKGKAKDLELSSGDIVYVPSSDLKFYLSSAPATAMSTGFYILARF